MPGSSPTGGFYYADYLKLPELLSAQAPESVRHGRPAHDEMLFIVIHQTYELWFKQILYELDLIQSIFGGDLVDDAQLGRVVHAAERIVKIEQLVVGQIDILETMTPMDFLEFRDLLMPASGFQSDQFRLIEFGLGLTGARASALQRPKLRRGPRRRYAQTHRRRRSPTLSARSDRRLAGAHAVRQSQRLQVSRSVRKIARCHALARRGGSKTSHIFRKAKRTFNSPRCRNRAPCSMAFWTTPVTPRCTHKATGRFRATRCKPRSFSSSIATNPRRTRVPHAQALMDIDETLALWRMRHALMVPRMLGAKSARAARRATTICARRRTSTAPITTSSRSRRFSSRVRALPQLPDEVEVDALPLRAASRELDSEHFSRSIGRAGAPLHFAAHSHHPWPDVTFEAQQKYWWMPRALLDRKWERVFGDVIPALQRHIARHLTLPDPRTLVFAPNTHTSSLRLLSATPVVAQTKHPVDGRRVPLVHPPNGSPGRGRTRQLGPRPRGAVRHFQGPLHRPAVATIGILSVQPRILQFGLRPLAQRSDRY